MYFNSNQPVMYDDQVDIHLEDFRHDVAQYGKLSYWDKHYYEDLDPFEVRSVVKSACLV